MNRAPREDPAALLLRRPAVGLACRQDIYERYIDARDVARLSEQADLEFRPFNARSDLRTTERDAEAEKELAGFCSGLDALIVCHGAPYLGADAIANAPRLHFVGELEGDRFANRIDLDAAHRQGITVVDTTHGSSWPTAEWALGLTLIGLRNAGALFRRLIAHETPYPKGKEWRNHGRGFDGAELSGKQIGLLGFGHVAWRLCELMAPFGVEVCAFDPYAPRELALAYNVAFAPIERVFAADVVICLLPLTPGTEKLIGADELELLSPTSVFVNVSRGGVVDSLALERRLARGDVVACLDVFDPEPFPLDSPLLDLANVFVSPHIAGVTEESRRRFFSLMVDELLRFFDGLEPMNALTARITRLRTTGHV